MKEGHQIKCENGFVYIDLYEKTTISILQKLLQLSLTGNKGQREFNQNYIKQSGIAFEDPLKESALRNVFVSSKIILIYGAAGTGKTTLINYISNLMAGRSKLFLTKTHILFNETKRFPLLYNNLKGRIVGIVKDAESVTFTIDIEVILTEMDCQGQDFELVDVFDNSSRISLTVYAYDDNTSDLEDSSRMNSIVPFQLAYAVSIHKAQGLEYDSVKVIIPQSNSEKITHGIFYTAITRAKKKLKIYWSAETMKEIVSGFATNESNGKSLEIVKAKLAVTQ